MPIDHTILGAVQPTQVGSPYDWKTEHAQLRQMTNQADMQELAMLETRRVQAEEEDTREKQEAFTDLLKRHQGDIPAARSEGIQIDPFMWQEVEARDQEARSTRLRGVQDYIATSRDKRAYVSESLKGVDPTDPQSWERARQAIAQADPEAAAEMPMLYDESWLEHRRNIAVSEEQENEWLERSVADLMNNKTLLAYGSAVAGAYTKEQYEEARAGFSTLPGVYADTIKLFPEWMEVNGVTLPETPENIAVFKEYVENLSLGVPGRARQMEHLEEQTGRIALERERRESDRQRQASLDARDAARLRQDEAELDQRGLELQEEIAARKAEGAGGGRTFNQQVKLVELRADLTKQLREEIGDRPEIQTVTPEKTAQTTAARAAWDRALEAGKQRIDQELREISGEPEPTHALQAQKDAQGPRSGDWEARRGSQQQRTSAYSIRDQAKAHLAEQMQARGRRGEPSDQQIDMFLEDNPSFGR